METNFDYRLGEKMENWLSFTKLLCRAMKSSKLLTEDRSYLKDTICTLLIDWKLFSTNFALLQTSRSILLNVRKVACMAWQQPSAHSSFNLRTSLSHMRVEAHFGERGDPWKVSFWSKWGLFPLFTTETSTTVKGESPFVQKLLLAIERIALVTLSIPDR